MQTKRKRYTKDSAPADDIVTLIQLVRQNPALYNYKLQPNQRRRVDVLSGWAQIAAQIGNKYTVEECRRKWKNLRDTYHQYRLRKPKLADGLSKWRYAKDLEFLCTVYQPKLKSHRGQQQSYMLEDVVVNEASSHHRHSEDSNGMEQHHHEGITLVNSDDAETFILAYGEDVADDMDHSEIVKNEPSAGGYVDPLDEDDGGVNAEVDYEEVCLYEEAGNAPGANCETIIGGAGGPGVDTRSPSPTDSKTFQYIDNFCIESSINVHDHQLPSPAAVSVVSSGSNNNIIATTTTSSSNSTSNNNNKLKNVAIVTNAGTLTSSPSPSTVTVFTTASAVAATATLLHTSDEQATTVPHDHNQQEQQQQILPGDVVVSPMQSVSTREELDLFFDFLKKKMQRFNAEEITSMQVEFLNCVLRCEEQSAQKANAIAAVGAAASQFSFVCKK